MARKRSRSTRNLDENARKALLEKRIASLNKKVEEMCILCGIKIGVIVFTPKETNVHAWPSLTQANDILNDYLACCVQHKQLEKLVILEEYLKKIVEAQEGEVSKMEEMVEEKEMEILFNQLAEGKSFYELDAKGIRGLLKVFDAKKTKLEERKKQLNEYVDENVVQGMFLSPFDG